MTQPSNPEEELFELPEDKNLELVGRLGKGAFGSVVKCVKRNDPEKTYALKKIPNYTQHNDTFARKVVREVKILHLLRKSPGICRLEKVFLSKNLRDVYLLMPCYDFDLESLMAIYRDNERILTGTQIKFIAYQILRALSSLHKNKLIHRDLTLKNLFVTVRPDKNFDVYLGDFGLSRAQPEETEERDLTLDVVTIEYRAPELLLQYSKYDSRCDCWAAGCIIAEMFICHRLFLPEPRDIRHALTTIIQETEKPDGDFVEQHASATGRSHVDAVVKDSNTINASAAAKPPNYVEGSDQRFPYKARLPLALRLAAAGADAHAVDVILRLLHFDFRKRLSADVALRMPWLKNDDDPEFADLIGFAGENDCGDVSSLVSSLPAGEFNSTTVTRKEDGAIEESVADLNELQRLRTTQLQFNLEAFAKETQGEEAEITLVGATVPREDLKKKAIQTFL